MQTIKNKFEWITTLDGTMTFGTIDNNQHILDFKCMEFAEVEPFIADCKVQAMHDGNVYIIEKPKRGHNKPLFREDNSTFTLGRDGKYYFIFTMPKDQVKSIPNQLVNQAEAIAEEVSRVILKKKKTKTK